MHLRSLIRAPAAEHCRPPCRLMVWFTPGPPIAPHQKVVAYLALRDLSRMAARLDLGGGLDS
jgi:hypothetical protein